MGIQNPPYTLCQHLTSLYQLQPGRIWLNEGRIAHARELYSVMVAEKEHKGEQIPLSEGALIFDEVKVGAKMHYHTKTGTLLCMCVSADQLGSLHDVYQTIQIHVAHCSKQASYILQYLCMEVPSISLRHSWSVLQFHSRYMISSTESGS